jgi:alanyl-tRNA synthetase
MVRADILGLKGEFLGDVTRVIAGLYRDDYPELAESESDIVKLLMVEEQQFRRTLKAGLKFLLNYINLNKTKDKQGRIIVPGDVVFEAFDTHGYPPDLTTELISDGSIGGEDLKGTNQLSVAVLADDWQETYRHLMNEQKERSRTATAGQFKGGLAEHNETTTKYHTATHLMYRALRNVLGDHVVQRGSNITNERLRFDFSHHAKMTPEEIKAVEGMVNEAIAKDYPVTWEEMKTTDAFEIGALGAFGDKYGDSVKVYTVGDKAGDWYSKEICGGPHVEHTGEIGKFRIKKEESSSAGVRRIKAVIE